MIDLSRAPLHAEGVTVFPDHADPTQFHYLPDCPRLRRRDDGSPELSLLEYRLDPVLTGSLGAGLLSLTVDLGVDDDVLKRLAGRLAHQFSLSAPPRLSPVVAESGHVELIAIDRASDGGAGGGAAPAPAGGGTDGGAAPAPAPAGSGAAAAAPDTSMVERILGGATPALFGDEACTFMVVLAADGVALVEAALRGGGLPIGVVYALQVLALRPALRAQITARWKDVYTFYDDRLHGGKLLFAVDVGATLEALVHSDAISVQIDDLVPEGDRDPAYKQALDLAQRYVLEQLFKPTLGQKPPPPDGSDGPLATIGNALKDFAGFFSLTYSLVQVNRDELKTMSYRLDAASAEKLTLAPQGTFPVLLDPGSGAPLDLAKIIVAVPPGASPEMTFDVGAAVDLAAEGIDHLEVFLRYGDRREDLLLDAATPRRAVTFFHDHALGLGVTSSYEVHFQPDAGAPEVLRSAETTGEARVIRIDPRALYRRYGLRLVAQGVPFDRFPQVIVDLAADDLTDGWSRTQTVVLDAAHPEGSFAARAALGAEVRLRRRVRYVSAQGAEKVLDWDVVEPGTLVVGDPFPAVLDVQIVGSARFGTVIAQLTVDLRPTSHPDQVATRVLTLKQPSATWSLALADPSDAAYEYRVTVSTTHSEVREGEWLAGSGGTLVVGEGIVRLRVVNVTFLGKTLAALGLLAIKVRFLFDDADAKLHAEDEILVQDLARPVTWSYPVADDARQAYVYQLSLVHSDGHIEVRDPVTTSDLLVIVPLV